MSHITESSDAPNSSSDTPYRLVAGDTFSGSLSIGDFADIVAVSVVAGENYTVIKARPDQDYYFPSIGVRDASFKGIGWPEIDPVVSDRGGVLWSTVTFTAQTTGIYYLTFALTSDNEQPPLNVESYTASFSLTSDLKSPPDPIWEPPEEPSGPNWVGTNGRDEFFGTSEDETFDMLAGNDRVHTGKGDDYVNLGAGNDHVRVGGGREEFHGGSGRDYISYYDSADGVNINLETNAVSGSWASNDTISGFESASGSRTGNDTIVGTSVQNTIKTFGGNDVIEAGGGNDFIFDGSGADTVFAGDGNDWVVVGGGADVFHGGVGIDMISYQNSRNGITADLQSNEVSGS